MSPGGGSSSGVGDVVSIDVVVDTSGLGVGGYHCDVVLDGGSGGSGVFGVDVSVIEGGGEVLDVSQEAGGYSFAVFDGRWAAQSFVPGLGSVCRLELSLSKRGSPGGDVTVSVRETLSGGDVASVVVSAGDLSGSDAWVEFDLVDVGVTPGSTYFVVVRLVGGDGSNCVLWRFGGGTGYGDGSLWFSSDGGGGWSSYGLYDFCFRTYGPGGPPVPVLAFDPVGLSLIHI